MTDVNNLQEQYHSTLKRMQHLRDELAAAGAIIKDEPHVAIYTWAIRELNEARDRQALLILLEVANHADEFGWCFPSFQRIGKLTGYDHNPGSTVEAAFSRLMSKDWVRVQATRNVRRKRIETDFVISPSIIYIRPELREQAWQRFNETPPRNSWGDLVTNLTKPYTEPTSVTKFTNQIHKPNTEPPPPPSPEGGAKNGAANHHSATAQHESTTRTVRSTLAHDHTPNPENSANLNSAQRNSEATDSTATPTPPSSAPPPHPPLPAEFDAAQPLPNAQDEAAAQEIYRMLHSLQLRHARRYVARYPRNKVLAAANVAISTPHVKNPVGKMDFDLRCSLIDEIDFDPVLGRKPGMYDDFIQR